MADEFQEGYDPKFPWHLGDIDHDYEKRDMDPERAKRLRELLVNGDKSYEETLAEQKLRREKQRMDDEEAKRQLIEQERQLEQSRKLLELLNEQEFHRKPPPKHFPTPDEIAAMQQELDWHRKDRRDLQNALENARAEVQDLKGRLGGDDVVMNRQSKKLRNIHEETLKAIHEIEGDESFDGDVEMAVGYLIGLRLGT